MSKDFVIENGVLKKVSPNVKEAVIPYGVTSIGREAFWGCKSVVSVTIPDSVTSIGEGAFKNCDSLADVTLPNGLRCVDDYVFLECSSLASITLPDSVTHIGRSAFSCCKSLISLALPDGLRDIGEYAFAGTGITAITIPPHVQTIKARSFLDCENLASLTLSEGLYRIDEEAFGNCPKLTSVKLPVSVEILSNIAFDNHSCTLLRSVNPEYVTHCYRLTDASTPGAFTLEGVGSFVYSSCSGEECDEMMSSCNKWRWKYVCRSWVDRTGSDHEFDYDYDDDVTISVYDLYPANCLWMDGKVIGFRRQEIVLLVDKPSYAFTVQDNDERYPQYSQNTHMLVSK